METARHRAANGARAPRLHAELVRKTFLSEAQSRPARNIQGQVFRNRTDLRTWFIQNFRLGDNLFNNVQVLQQDAKDNIVMDCRREFFSQSLQPIRTNRSGRVHVLASERKSRLHCPAQHAARSRLRVVAKIQATSREQSAPGDHDIYQRACPLHRGSLGAAHQNSHSAFAI